MKTERRRATLIVTTLATGIAMLMTAQRLMAQTGPGQCDPITCSGRTPCTAKPVLQVVRIVLACPLARIVDAAEQRPV